MRFVTALILATVNLLSWCPAIAAPNLRSLVDPETWVVPSDGIEVTRSGIRIGSVLVRLPSTEKELVSVLGSPDRREPGQNRILVWDQLGIFAYQEPDVDVIHSVAVSFTCDDFAFCPKGAFPGALVIGEAVFLHAPDPRDIVRYGFKADEFTCFRNLGKYQVSVDCTSGGFGLGTFEISRKK